MKKFNDIYKGVDLRNYGPIPFWSWNNKLEKDELIKQIHNMKDVGMGGFIMHARMGLTTEYLGEDWFDCIEVCLDEAKKLGMNGWIYDENGWPSGFVGGELLKDQDNLATYLEMEEGVFDCNAYCSFIREKSGFKRIYGDQGEQKVYNVYLKYSQSNTDILKPSVVTQFIDATYEKYYERFKDRFGKELVGFFTDEPQYFRWGTPYSITVIDYFKEHYGEDVKDGLIHIFFNEPENFPFRVRYYSALNDLYTFNFYKRINDWCNDHGCLLTGHSIEESALYLQMWGCADVMPSYEFEGIPGIDNLGKNSTAKLSARQIGSVCAQLDKKQILTETYGCSGYDVTPRQLRAIAEKQYVHGVNLMCHHLYNYSLAGQGKTDHPPCFSKHMTWNKDFKTFNDYFTRLGYLIANGKDTVKTAVLSPMSSIHLKYKRFDEKDVFIIDQKLVEFQNDFAKYNVEYHIIDEKILKRHGRVEGNTLIVGSCRYENFIIPYVTNVYSSTEELLKQYTEAGGKLLVWENVPSFVDGNPVDLSYLKSNTTFEEIKSSCEFELNGNGVDFTHRKFDDIEYAFIFNEDHDKASITFDKSYYSVDVLTGEVSDVNGMVTLEKNSSCLLVKGVETSQITPYFTQETDITGNFAFLKATDNTLTADFVCISEDGVNYSEPQYVYKAFYTLIKRDYKGKLWVKYLINVQDLCSVKMLKEIDKGFNHTFNGHPITFTPSEFDVNFCECDLTQYLKTGVNEYVYCVDFYESPIVRYALYDPDATESVRNCLVYDTEIEQLYIKGNFSVENGKIVRQKTDVAINDVTGGGYPFFAGEIAFKANFNAKAGIAQIRLDGNYMSAVVTVNGKEYRTLLDNKVIVDTVEGENTIELSFTASLRNMIGPLHVDVSDVSPYSFRLYNEYDVERPTPYIEEHVFRPFGITKVTVKQ